MKPFSIQVITSVVDVVTGGSGGGNRPPIGRYRTGPELENFLGEAGLELHIGTDSRVPAVRKVLSAHNRQPEGREAIVRLIEQVTDPREYDSCPEKHKAVLDYLNKQLRLDGYELRELGERHRLVNISTNVHAASELLSKASALDMDSVQRNLDQALAEADANPEGAITAACSTVESVCKCLLDEMGQPYPAKQDIGGLAKEVCKHLNLSPDRSDLPQGAEQDIRQILGGLAAVTGGIGSVRTHAGDAHGRGKSASRVDGRIARLAIHAATTVSLFYIETWQRNHQPLSRP